MEARNKNALIGGLLAIVFVMAVGYAAFATQLNISGTAETTSKWDVHIESITPGTPVGTAKNIAATVGEDKLSATFETELISPGDSISYTVVVRNNGNLRASLSEIRFSQGSTAAITHTYAGIAEGDVIEPGQSATFTVTATYNSLVTSQPADSDLENEVTMVLSYVQATGTTTETA